MSASAFIHERDKKRVAKTQRKNERQQMKEMAEKNTSNWPPTDFNQKSNRNSENKMRKNERKRKKNQRRIINLLAVRRGCATKMSIDLAVQRWAWAQVKHDDDGVTTTSTRCKWEWDTESRTDENIFANDSITSLCSRRTDSTQSPPVAASRRCLTNDSKHQNQRAK